MHHGYGNLDKAIDLLDMKEKEDFRKFMNENNSLSKTKKNKPKDDVIALPLTSKTRKKREELSVSAIRTFKKEKVEITVKFD